MIPTSLLEQLRSGKQLTLFVKAAPKSSRNEVSGLLEDGTLKVKVTAAPEKGKANAAICKLLAAEFGVPKRNVSVVRGAASLSKQVVISL